VNAFLNAKSPMLDTGLLGDTGRIINQPEDWRDSFLGKTLADVAKPAALLTKNHVNPVSGNIEQTNGTARAELVLGAVLNFTSGGRVKTAEALVSNAAKRAVVSVDTNALAAAIEKGGVAAIDAALGGRIPIVSMTAAKEFLVKGNVDALRKFLTDRGGRIASAASEVDAAALRAQASQMGRSLGVNDSRIAASAVKEGAPVLTKDGQFSRFLKAAGIPTLGF
jgi:predicted nucleic acid-binding protein